MTSLAGNRALLKQVMAGDTEFVRCFLAPVVDYTELFIMALPALVIDQFLVPVMAEIDGFGGTHFKLDDVRPEIVWLGSLNLGGRKECGNS
jgi:pyruvate/2-oxoacid:ferredoxin oxidoreductase alpha subunit